MKKPIVGEKMPTWFSDQNDGLSTIIAVEPYNGLYKQWFTWIVKLSAPRTHQGWMEMAV